MISASRRSPTVPQLKQKRRRGGVCHGMKARFMTRGKDGYRVLCSRAAAR